MTSTPPPRPSLPLPPSPGQPLQAPHFVFWGRGPLSPGPPPWPHPLKVFPVPSLSLPLAGFSPCPLPLPFSSLFCDSVPLLLLTPTSQPPPWALFYSPSTSPQLWLMPSLVLDNYQIYQWGERSVCVVLAFWTGGVGGMVSLCWHRWLGDLCNQEFHRPSSEVSGSSNHGALEQRKVLRMRAA